jgi:anaerobic magnesium-protoporphyrin IX monomethyl ester cyclase
MRISLVQSPRWSIFTPSYAVALLTGNLRSKGFTCFQKDFDVTFYNAVNAEQKELWHNDNAMFWNSAESVKQMIADYRSVIDAMVDEVLQDDPTLVGFSVKIWSQWFSQAMAERLKQVAPHVTVVFGGPQMSTGKPDEFLEEHPEVDAVCLKEADISFPRWLQKMESAGGAPQPEPGFVYRTASGEIVDCGPIKEIPKAVDIPYADYSDYDFSQYRYSTAITMLMSRGCINRCSYCSEAPHFLRFRAYPAERIFEEIRHHWNHTNVGRPMRVFFNDSLLNGNMRELERLADILIAHRDEIQIEYGGMMLIRDELTEELVGKLARSGLTDILFGLETGSPEVLKLMRKRYKHETAEKVFKYCHDQKVRVVASVIFGHPGESEAEFYKSLRFLRANAHNIDLFLLNYMGVYDGSDISIHPEKYGVDPESISESNHWVGDGGANTFEIRMERVNMARLALGQKVADIGGFDEGQCPLYDPASPFKERIAELTIELDGLYQRCLEPVKVHDFLDAPAEKPIGYIDCLTQEDGQWKAKGWASEPGGDGAAKEVVLINQHGKILSYCRVSRLRDDVAAVFGKEKFGRCGWETVFPATQLDAGENVVRAFVYDPAKRRAYRLHGEFNIQSA